MMKSTLCFLAVVLLLCTVFGLIAVIGVGLIYVREYYGPSLQIDLPDDAKENLERNCRPTTDDLQDLVLSENISDDEATSIVEDYGTGIFPEILTKKTAHELREYAMRENRKLRESDATQLDVIESDHRYNFMPDIYDDAVLQDALQQVGQHKRLRYVLDAILGTGSSLVNLSILTAEYGAKGQHIHTDTGTGKGRSAAADPYLFMNEYTLVIALQDTTKEMGTTHLCPGTQGCSSIAQDDEDDDDEDDDEDDEDDDDDDDREAPICKVRATVSQGDGFLFNSDLFHRGAAHTDPDAMERVFLFLLFTEGRRSPRDTRILPFGEVRGLDWRRWGHTIDELATVRERPWRWWQSLGLFPTKRADGVRPWNFVDNFLLEVYTSDDEGASVHSIGNDFNTEDFEKIARVFLSMSYFLLIGIVYLVLLPALLFGWFFYGRPTLVAPIKHRADYTYVNGNGFGGKEKEQ